MRAHAQTYTTRNVNKCTSYAKSVQGCTKTKLTDIYVIDRTKASAHVCMCVCNTYASTHAWKTLCAYYVLNVYTLLACTSSKCSLFIRASFRFTR